MPSVLCHPNRYPFAASGISHVPAAVFGGNRYGLYHRNLCHYHLLCRLHHRKTGRKPQISLGPACRKHLLYPPVDSVHGDENARQSVYHTYVDRACALCRWRHVRRDVKLKRPLFLVRHSVKMDLSEWLLYSYRFKRAAGNSSHTTENPAALFFLRNCSVPFSLINNPPVVGYYPVVVRLLTGYCPVTLRPNLAAAPKYPYMDSSSFNTAL